MASDFYMLPWCDRMYIQSEWKTVDQKRADWDLQTVSVF